MGLNSTDVDARDLWHSRPGRARYHTVTSESRGPREQISLLAINPLSTPKKLLYFHQFRIPRLPHIYPWPTPALKIQYIETLRLKRTFRVDAKKSVLNTRSEPMFIPKRIKKLLAIFRGEVSPILILLSVLLGFWFGVTPGWYGIHVLILIFALVLSIHSGIFLMWVGFGKAFCYGLAPLMYYTGQWTQTHLQWLLDLFAGLPILGLTDYARFSVAGALVIGPVLGLIFGALLARSVHSFRKTWLSLYDNSDAFRKWQGNRWIKLLDKLLVGKRAEDVQAVLKRKPKLFRIPGIIIAVVLIAASAAGLGFVQGDRLTELVSDSLTRANGAQVDLEKIDLAPFSGRITASGLAVTDPQRPTHNRITAATLTADANLWNLLRGRFVMDELVLASVQFNAPRAAPGEVHKPITTEAEAAEPAFEPTRFNLPTGDLARLETYFANAQELRDWLKKLSTWLPAPDEQTKPAPAALPQSYLEYVSARALTPPTPRVVVKHALFDNVSIPNQHFGDCKITCQNLSDAPAAAASPLSVEIQSNEKPTSIKIVRRFDLPEFSTEVEGSIGDVDLHELQQNLNPRNPVVFESGTATTQISGTANRRSIDLTLATQVQGLRASASGGLFGLDPQVTQEAFRAIENIQTTMRIVGPTTAPRITFDGPAMTEQFKTALVGAGKAELARRVDELVGDKLPGGVPKVDEALQNPVDAVGNTLTGLLEKQQRDKAEKDKAEGEKKKKPDNPLDRLRQRLEKEKEKKQDND